eukprot:TRINITY_DN31729_c0_g1_i1.p1 TRINITY_DN31729_c0_g1~~TRINITY_DN31729_c0_g1_i1.p1  ORF type:complete len:207 (-),score=39.71 TRINITY_DN31729_c0_g1_i1:137-757(-)
MMLGERKWGEAGTALEDEKCMLKDVLNRLREHAGVLTRQAKIISKRLTPRPTARPRPAHLSISHAQQSHQPDQDNDQPDQNADQIPEQEDEVVEEVGGQGQQQIQHHVEVNPEEIQPRVQEVAQPEVKKILQKPFQKVRWQPDSARKNCNLCRKNFGFFRRRHHCRCCGLLYCADCAGRFLPIPQLHHHDAVRVCDVCVVKVRFNT